MNLEKIFVLWEVLDQEAHSLLKQIENEQAYDAALKVFEALIDRMAGKPNSPLNTLMPLLADGIQAYERRVYPMDDVGTQEKLPSVVQLKTGLSVILDCQDCDRVLSKKWSGLRYSGGTLSARRSYREHGRVLVESLAQFIMRRPAVHGEVWTHRNGDSLDNRKANIVSAKIGQHLERKMRDKVRTQARTRMSDPNHNPRVAKGKWMMGVTKIGNRFRARVKDGDKQVVLGSFATEEEAARAYDDARERLGLARVNFPKQEGPEQ